MAVQPINACLPFSHIAGIMALLINKMIDGQANNRLVPEPVHAFNTAL